MDLDVIFVIGTILIYIIVVLVILSAFILTAGFIANYFNLTGIMWWAVAFVSFSVLMGLAGGISIKIRRD